ncbi:hypothetical protein HAX54_002784, partial [Datura stramonium]|nr:hypothetical protein [Datura stramonium]
ITAHFLNNTIPREWYNVRSESPNASMFDPLLDEFVGRRISEIVEHIDGEYAEELQLQEALVASLYTEEGDNQLNNFCEICLDNKESWEMFPNNGCSHSFHYECTSNHILERISLKTKVIGFPGVSCGASFDVNACRFMIPEEARILWDESEVTAGVFMPLFSCPSYMKFPNQVDTSSPAKPGTLLNLMDNHSNAACFATDFHPLFSDDALHPQKVLSFCKISICLPVF